MPLILLNTSVLTNYGVFEYRRVSVEKAREMVVGAGQELVSAIGHEAVSEILSDILGVPVPVNRIDYTHKVGEIALVFKLKKRVREGVILSREEVKRVGYEFGLLTMVAL